MVLEEDVMKQLNEINTQLEIFEDTPLVNTIDILNHSFQDNMNNVFTFLAQPRPFPELDP
jgi:hypothetical protein